LEAWVGDDEGRRCDEKGMLRTVERLEFPGREGRRRRGKGKDIKRL
jgi:hypothetical protein